MFSLGLQVQFFVGLSCWFVLEFFSNENALLCATYGFYKGGYVLKVKQKKKEQSLLFYTVE